MKAGGRVNRKHFHEPHLSVGGDLAKIAAKSAKAAEKTPQLALKIKPPSDNILNVRQANCQYPKSVGNQTVKIGELSGGVRLNNPTEAKRVKQLADKIASPDGYISRIIVDQNNNVIEGQHRLEALRQLGVQDVPVYKIEELADTMPVSNMESAIRAAGPIHPDHAGRLVSHALEHISEGGMESARQMDYGKFQKYYNAALDAIGEPKPDLSKAQGGEVHMSIGGKLTKTAAKAAEKVQHPLIFPRALAKTKEEIRPIAQRIAEQMTGDFVRQDPKVTTNPAGKSRKQFNREQEIPMETRRLIPESEVPAIDYETKLGQSLVGVPGDPTLGSVVKKGTLESSAQPSVELTRVGDVVPEHPVPLFGGPRYGNEERFWASNLGAAQPVQNRANKLGEEYGAPVLGQYIKMAPDSANFAMHNLDALLAIQQPEKLPKAKMEDLNKLIREGSKKYGKFPNFVGFQDPLDVLLNTQFNSNLRKHIAETLTKPTITNELGLVNGLDVVAAITHPELRNMETGISGFSIGEMRPGSNLREFASEHPTYDTDIPGAMIGQSKYPTPYEIAFPDTTAYTRSNLKPGVQEFNMLKMLGPRERIDQQYIDEIKMYEELMKEYTGKKKGGLAQAKKPKKVARHGNTVPN